MALTKLLAVAHEVTLTGSPMNLLHFITWMRENTDTEVDLLVLRDGALLHRFEQVCNVKVIDQAPFASFLGTIQTGLMHLGSSRVWKPIAKARLAPQLRHLTGYDLIYANSIASSAVLPYIPPAPVTIAHVHELQVALRTWNQPEFVAALREMPTAWIAVSDAVRRMLIDEHDLPADRVKLHYEFIDAKALINRHIDIRQVEEIRRGIGIPTDAAVVMGAGTIDWRKGADMFVQLAVEVSRRTREPVRFVWVGGDLLGTDFERLRSDMERSGANNVHFVGVKPDPVPWFAMGDIFALTSREDPYPLVCLENAALRIPIVTYRNGGIPELLEASGAEAALGVVDYMDVGAMADRVLDLLNSDLLHRRASEQLYSHVLANHDVSVAAPKLYRELVKLTG